MPTTKQRPFGLDGTDLPLPVLQAGIIAYLSWQRGDDYSLHRMVEAIHIAMLNEGMEQIMPARTP